MKAFTNNLLGIGMLLMLNLLLYACQKEPDLSNELEQQKQRIDSIATASRFPLSVSFTDSASAEVVSPGGVRIVGFSIESPLDDIQIEVIGSSGIVASVEPDSDSNTGIIKIIAGEYMESQGKAVVLVTDGYSLLMRTLHFEKTVLRVDTTTNAQIGRKGGTITLPYLANVVCKVEIPVGAQSWIKTISTKAAIQHDITLSVSANDGKTRSAQVTLMDPDRWKQITFTIEQAGGGDTISFLDANIKAALVARFDLDGDGQISYSEADSVTSPEGVFPANKSYTSFNELHYFTGVKELPARCFTDQTSLTSITLPEGLTMIGDRAFYQCRQLQEINLPTTLSSIGRLSFGWCYALEQIDIPESVTAIGDAAFASCINLKTIKGKYATDDGRCLIIDKRLIAFATANLEQYAIPEEITAIGPYAFTNSTVPRIDLPATLQEIEHHAFYSAARLSIINSAVQEPPTKGDKAFTGCSYLSHIYVPETSVDAYKQAWPDIAGVIGVPRIPEGYRSTDFSRNGTVIPLQTATRGNGIDIVIMGDAFCDLSIADGTYHSIMQKAQEAFFSVEPYKSYRDCFNFYEIEVVSEREGFEEGSQGHALGTWYGESTTIGGNDSINIDLAQKAINNDERMDNVTIVILSNNYAHYGGMVYANEPIQENMQKDYACGLSNCYLPVITNDMKFANLVIHEVGGHGFAKLADEYSLDGYGTVPTSLIDSWQTHMNWGWWKNIDFTSSPAHVKWAGFLTDPRYADEDLGVYEGGGGYAKGVWRPSETGMMNILEGPFNAPSRYAIWYRIQRLAFGENQPAGYEDFVAYDKAAHNAPKRSGLRIGTDENIQEAPIYSYPPVITSHNWRDVLKKQ